ncbi:sigma-70 family RNA polymerase sigma factor [Myxococcus sp. CA033]|uniref:RNA polymerase sigma factor n=1 Tax=Myxococcus sp. CA033 TaxID=2741516 RepID=UPI00157AC10D|nr:sigma-70 family RNA polymerase sigma factor [Myxococcus sp. CA033]
MTAKDISQLPASPPISPGFLSWVAELVHEHRERLLTHARRRGLDAEDALDAVQESFFSFFRLPEAREIARDSDDSVKLLTVILRHNLMNRRRKHSRQSKARLLLEAGEAAQDTVTSEEFISRTEQLAWMHGCISRMAQLQRRVVMLSLLDEQPSGEVGKLLGISDGYVRVLLHRAREQLRHCSFEYDGL